MITDFINNCNTVYETDVIFYILADYYSGKMAHREKSCGLAKHRKPWVFRPPTVPLQSMHIFRAWRCRVSLNLKLGLYTIRFDGQGRDCAHVRLVKRPVQATARCTHVILDVHFVCVNAEHCLIFVRTRAIFWARLLVMVTARERTDWPLFSAGSLQKCDRPS